MFGLNDNENITYKVLEHAGKMGLDRNIYSPKSNL